MTHNFRTEPQTKSEVANLFDEAWHGKCWEVYATQDSFTDFVGTGEEHLCGELVPELFLELRLFVDLIAKPQMKAAVAKIEYQFNYKVSKGQRGVETLFRHLHDEVIEDNERPL